MQKIDLSRPGEKKKLIWAGILGFVAVMFLWWTFFGFGSSSPSTAPKPTGPSANTARPNQRQTRPGSESASELTDLTSQLQEVSLEWSHPEVPEPRRNIFAYYEPVKVVKPPPPTPTPTPTPTPPLLLTAISPQSVYARTGEFNLEVAGDKFTPELRIFVDSRELATKYRSPQQLSAMVPAAIIANPGTKQIAVRTSDGRLYSNIQQLTVAAPPIPNYSYVGLIDTVHRVSTAIVQDKSNKEVLNVQRGDLLSGRFRVTSISEKELVLIDSTLKIRHTIAMSEGERTAGSPLSRPTPRVDAEDDEP